MQSPERVDLRTPQAAFRSPASLHSIRRAALEYAKVQLAGNCLRAAETALEPERGHLLDVAAIVGRHGA
jgi:hypothetical protein